MPRALLLALAFVAGPTAAATAEPQRPIVEKTLAEAEALALHVVPGTVVESELERERGRWVYSIEIRPARGGQVEVLIDANDGSTVAIEPDEDDDDDDGDDD
jgi:uncharacterized membrane protein YkoI